MPDFYLHRQQWLNYEKSGKPIGYPIFPPMFSFLFPSPLLRISFSFPNLNRQPWQKSGPITARRSENAQKTCLAIGFAGCQTVLLHFELKIMPQTYLKLQGKFSVSQWVCSPVYLDCYVFIHRLSRPNRNGVMGRLSELFSIVWKFDCFEYVLVSEMKRLARVSRVCKNETSRSRLGLAT